MTTESLILNREQICATSHSVWGVLIISSIVVAIATAALVASRSFALWAWVVVIAVVVVVASLLIAIAL